MKLDTNAAEAWLREVEQDDGYPTLFRYAKKLGTTLPKLIKGLSENTVEPRDVIDAQIEEIGHQLELRMVKHGSLMAFNRLKQPPFNWKPEEETKQVVGNPELVALLRDALVSGKPAANLGNEMGRDGGGENLYPPSPNRISKSTLPIQ